MLIDVHSHYFRYPDHFSKDFIEQSKRARNTGDRFNRALGGISRRRCDVRQNHRFRRKAKLSGLWVPDAEVADYVRSHSDKLIGFLSVDPTQPGWRDELEEGHRSLRLKGIKLLPMYAGFHPNDRAWITSGITPSVTTCPVCCTPARLSSGRRRSK